MTISKRNIGGPGVVDQASLDNQHNSNPAGAKKVSEVGRHLLPLNLTATTFTTDASTIKSLPAQGRNIAVYNNAGTVGSVTLGEANTQASLGPGVCDGTGHVGIPCAPNAWTYIACFQSQWVITSASTLMVFLIDDDSYVRVQSQNNAST